MKVKTGIISFSGSHGTGKTTSAYRRAIDLGQAMSGKSIHALVDLEATTPTREINKQATPDSQAWIFANQINQELFYSSRHDIVVTDRTIVDAIAYTRYAGFDALAHGMIEFAKAYMSKYAQICIKLIRNNRFLYDNGIRETRDPAFRQGVEDVLLDVYNDLIRGGYIPCQIFYQ